MNLFGKKNAGKAALVSAPPPPDTASTITMLNDRMGMMEKRITHLRTKAATAHAQAADYAKKKDLMAAKRYLAQWQECNKQTERLGNSIFLLQRQANALEAAVVDVEVIHVAQQANQAMQAIRGNISVDAAEDVMDQFEELQEDSEAIGEVFGRQMEQSFQDPDLLAELEKLQASADAATTPATASATTSSPTYAAAPVSALPPPQLSGTAAARLPSVPVSVFPDLPTAPTASTPTAAASAEEDEEAVLRALAAGMM